MSSFDQVVSWANELLICLGSDEDVRGIEDLKTRWLDIQKQKEKQHQHIRRAIAGLIELKEEELRKNHDTKDLNSQQKVEEVKILKRKIAETATLVDKVVGETKEKKAMLEKQSEEQQHLKSEQDRIGNEKKISLPKAKYEVNLYSHVTNIRWRYECPPNEISGYMCDGKNVRPFSFDRNQVSEFFTVNSLWDLMEED